MKTARCIYNLLKMNPLKVLSKRQVAAVFIILIIITTSLFVWEKYDNRIEDKVQHTKYTNLLEENQVLRNEIENLNKQNQLLYKVLGLKKDLVWNK